MFGSSRCVIENVGVTIERKKEDRTVFGRETSERNSIADCPNIVRVSVKSITMNETHQQRLLLGLHTVVIRLVFSLTIAFYKSFLCQTRHRKEQGLKFSLCFGMPLFLSFHS